MKKEPAVVAKKMAVNTKDKLIGAACEIFAEKGFRDATIADICEKAGANIAAVNYHFGDKETLYTEAWRHSFRSSTSAYPPDGGVAADAPPAERLRGRIWSMLQRIADEKYTEFFIVQKEIVNPTGLLKEVMRAEIQPMREQMLVLIRELLGPRAVEDDVAFCARSVISQCLHLIHIKALVRGNAAWLEEHGMVTRDTVDRFVDHIVKFSLAGISAVREEVERNNGGSAGDE